MIIKIFKAIGIVAILCSAYQSPALALYADSQGREWRMLTDTVGFSWDQIADEDGAGTGDTGVCDPNTGFCSGNLFSDTLQSDVSFDGWTWASSGEVFELIDELIDPVTFTGSYTQYDSTWGPLAIQLFGDVMPFSANPFPMRTANGQSRTLLSTEAAGVAIVDRSFRQPDNIHFITDPKTAIESELAILGARGLWSYRPETLNPIPVPGAVWLFGTALIGLIGFGKRKTG